MKKLILCMIAALMALTACFSVLADDNDAVNNSAYDSMVNLLFNTNNVTLNAKVDFSLDGAWFKTAEGTWKQDYSRSFRELVLRAPRADGTERKNGYTIVTEDDKLYLMEAFTPGIYRSGNCGSRTSILRKTVGSDQLVKLGSVLMANADLVFGKGTVTDTADSFTIELGSEVPGLFNTALNELASFAAKRYFNLDYDEIRSDSQVSMASFTTKSQALLYTMKELSLRQAAITVTKDGNGGIKHAEGTISLYVSTAADGVHQLDITLQADITDIGATMVKKFDPNDYNVTQASDEAAYYNTNDFGTESSIQEGAASSLPDINALSDEIAIEAMKAWAESGFDMRAATSVSFEERENNYEVFIEDGNGSTWRTFFKKDGSFSSMQAEPNDWQRDISKYTYEPTPDAAEDRKAKEFMMSFLKKVTPNVLEKVKDLKMEWIYENNGAVYAQYNEYPLDQQGSGVLLVLRMSPEMQVEYYSCTING